VSEGRPKLLFVSPRFLFPLDEGGKIRTANTLRHMKGGAFEIVLASPTPAKSAGRFADDIAAVCDRFLGWPLPKASAVQRVMALAGALPVSVAGDRSAVGRPLIADAIAAARPDLVLADFPHAAVLLPDDLPIPAVIFTHNVEAEILERHAAVARGPWRLVWADQARKMRRFEAAALSRFDRAIAVSERDAQRLRQRYALPAAAVEAIDTGIDLDFYPFAPPDAAPGPTPDGGTVVFVGAMNSPANIDAVDFLIDEVWPSVAAVRGAARMVVVGRNPPPALVARVHKKTRSCEFTGYVEDTRPYIRQAHLAVIPIRVGSGTRIKAFEAMALGRPVVSTTVGVEGLGIAAGSHYLAADNAADFAEAVLRLLADGELRNRLAHAARARLEERFSWATVARQFENICLRTLRQQRQKASPQRERLAV
jgi:polysaccharide biosynthesis protein PslH